MRSLLILCLLPLIAQAGKPALPELMVPEGLGVNIHFTSPRPGEMKMLADAGFKFIRMDLSWGATERKKGEYDFSAYDRLIESLAPHNIRALFILDYSNRNYDNGLSPFSDEGRAAFAAWSATAAKHFAGKGILWEMYNEPNIHFWKPTPNVEHYTKLALAVGKALRQAAPDELYVGPATSQIDLKFLEDCFKAGCLEYWDAVTVHPYRQKDPETVNEEYRNLRLLIAKYAPKGKTIPILSGEWGYSAAWGKFDEVLQGKYLPRQFLVNLYNQVPLSIWYDWHDDGKDPKEAEHHFGTVSFEYLKDKPQVYAPKDAYKAAQTLTTQLAGFKYNKRLWTGDEADWVLLFDKGNDVKVAAWTTRKEAHEITIPASPGKFAGVSYMGDATRTIEAVKAGLKLTLTDTIQYLTPEAPNDLLRLAAAWECAPLDYSANDPSIPIPSLKNVLPRPINVKIGLSTGRLSDHALKPGEGTTATVAESDQVRRLDHRATMVAHLEVEGVRLSQATQWISARPLFITVYPPVGRSFAIGVVNPSRRSADLRFQLAQGMVGFAPADYEAQITFKPNSPEEQFTLFPLFVDPMFRTRIVAINAVDDGQLIGELKHSQVSVLHFIYTQDEVRGALKLIADGDAKVSSKYSLDVPDKPEKLPTGQTPDAFKISYSFDPGWKFIRLVSTKDDLKTIEGKPKHLGMWLYGDESGNQVRLRFVDAQGEVFQPHGVTLNFKGWKWVTIPMDGSEAGHWGKEDGVVQYPIRWDTFLLIDSAHRKQTAGEIWAAGMTLIE